MYHFIFPSTLYESSSSSWSSLILHLFKLVNFSHILDVWWYISVVFICITLVNNNTEHHFMCLFVEASVQMFLSILRMVFLEFCLIYVFWMQVLFWIYTFAITFSLFVACIFILFILSMACLCVFSFFIYFFTYFFIWQAESGRESSSLLVHSPNFYNSWCWAGPTLEAGNAIQAPHVGGRNSVTPKVYTGKKWSQGLQPGTEPRSAGIECRCLYC